MEDNCDKKSAVISIVGRPNVGKSSLLNQIIGQKISIVSNKPQTTRTRVTGIFTENNIQLVFVDTPGVHQAHNTLEKYMNKQTVDSVIDVDVCMLVVEAGKKIYGQEKKLIEKFKSMKVFTMLVINKIDMLKDKSPIIEQINQFSKELEFDSVIPVSVKRHDGINRIITELKKQALDGGYIFDSDLITDQPRRAVFAEFIREKMLRLLDKEIPYGIAVNIEHIKSKSNGVLEIHSVIYCEKESHKGIIIGKNGQMLKRIGTLAREELEKVFSLRINLKLWVTVKEDWRNKNSLVVPFVYGQNKM